MSAMRRKKSLAVLAWTILSISTAQAQTDFVTRYRGTVDVAILEVGEVAIAVDEATGPGGVPDGWVDRVFTFTPRNPVKVPTPATYEHAEVAYNSRGRLQIVTPLAGEGFLMHVEGPARSMIRSQSEVPVVQGRDLGHYWGYQGMTAAQAFAHLDRKLQNFERMMEERRQERRSASTGQGDQESSVAPSVRSTAAVRSASASVRVSSATARSRRAAADTRLVRSHRLAFARSASIASP